MAPVPLEGHYQAPVTNNLPQEGNRCGSISLGVLIDWIIQRTYHEVTVLAELLPRKTDMERKIEIYNFSTRTRQLFVRLLALVKWANSASKVDKSGHIMSFLDKQSLLFIDTADILARMARETLVHARLPNFHIPAAVEVLTTGTYARLPACIKEKIVPPDAVTVSEKKQTLQRLNQVIQHRLVIGKLLPQMRNLSVDNGCVTFNVDQEFSVSLTVMGDGLHVPWRLLTFDILVSDRETGNGKPLVHPLQVQYLHQVIQARLSENNDPLSEVYQILHYFCQSLQLEVLYSQTLRLIRDRLDDYIHIEEYVPGKSLTILYWRELSNEDPKSELGYKLSVHVNPTDPSKPLEVVHVPSLGNKEIEISDRAVKSSQLSMECLLVHTIYIRTKNRLLDLKQELQAILKNVECNLAGSPAVLSVPILQPCLRAELLLIAVDTHTGMLRCHVPQYEAPIIPELTAAINSDHSKLPHLISELRYWITQRRCEKTLQHLPATPLEKLPLKYFADHPITRISKHRMFVQFYRHPNILLIVAFKEKELTPSEIECSFYTCTVKPCSIDDDPNDENIESDLPRMYLRLQSLVEFDAFVTTHGPFTQVDFADQEEERSSDGRKRRKIETRKLKCPAYYIPELAHVVAYCDEKMPFLQLSQELTKREIGHQGLQVEANATALVLKIIELPLPPHTSDAILKRLLSCSIRAQGKGSGKSWLSELVFNGSPLTTNHPKEQGLRRPVYFNYEMGAADQVARTVDQLLADWTQIVNLYTLVHDFTENYYNNERYNLQNLVSIKSYNYVRLIFAYGPHRNMTATVQWQAQKRQFKLFFGTRGNPHSLLREQLEAHLNKGQNLMQTIYILNETLQPLTSIGKLPSTAQVGVHDRRPGIPVKTFTVLPQCVTLVRVAYQSMYCLELRMRGNGIVSIRDGAYSRFDRSNVVDEFTPTQGLKTFLSKYVDENAIYRRRSQSEDDNPPSPVVTMDQETSAPTSQRSPGRFHAPMTPPSGSNPHTPASPHTVNISSQQQQQQSQGQFGSSPATPFNLASPPVANSPMSQQVHAASPASGVMASTSSPGPCSGNVQQLGHSPYGAHIDGSPFPPSQGMASPAASNWPNSPSIPRPSPVRSGAHMMHSPQQTAGNSHLSRVLPQRSWAGAVPTLLPVETLELLCNPSPHPSGLPGQEMSPLERFLGCVYMRRQLQRFIQTNECLAAINSTEPGVVHFKVDTLQCRVFLNPQHLQSLNIKIQPLPEHIDKWTMDEIQAIEMFFERRAAAPPFRPVSLHGFGKMLNLPLNVLKDFVQIMRLEHNGASVQPPLRWMVRWCLRVPPSPVPMVPFGQAAILISKSKILFYLQITRNVVQFPGEPIQLLLPLVFDLQSNVITMADKREQNPAINAVTQQLKRFTEYGTNPGETVILPAVRDLLMNLNLGGEGPVAGGPVQVGPPGPGGPMQVGGPMGGPGGPMGQPGMNPQVGPQMQNPGMQMHAAQMGANQPSAQGGYGGMPTMGMMGGPQ